MRLTRLIYSDPQEGYYHITSRIAFKLFVLNEDEKEHFVKLLRWLSQVYFVRVATYSIMTNHFHIILQMIPPTEISDAEIESRFQLYYNSGKSDDTVERFYIPQEAEAYRKRWADLSRFIQDLKQRFSRWYNRHNDNKGTIWSSRFKSVMLESSRALLSCMVYVELNSVRAGIVQRPEDYQYCGFNAFLEGGHKSIWLYSDSLKEAMPELRQALSKGVFHDLARNGDLSYLYLRRYHELIYRSGVDSAYKAGCIPDEVADESLTAPFTGSDKLFFNRRIRYFTDGVILGSKTFVDEKFHEFRYFFNTNRQKEGQVINYRTRKENIIAPDEHLLHLFSIRSFYKKNG